MSRAPTRRSGPDEGPLHPTPATTEVNGKRTTPVVAEEQRELIPAIVVVDGRHVFAMAVRP